MIILFILIASILLSLAAAFFFLWKDKPGRNRVVTSLTVRIILSFVLFGFLFVALYFGWLKPHPLANF